MTIIPDNEIPMIKVKSDATIIMSEPNDLALLLDQYSESPCICLILEYNGITNFMYICIYVCMYVYVIKLDN